MPLDLQNKKDYNAMYVESHRELYRARRKSDKGKAREFVGQFLVSHPCVDCGESDPIVLDFDHVCGEKKLGISLLIKNKYSLRAIYAEIQKCEVRCSNCHRKRHHKERSKQGG